MRVFPRSTMVAAIVAAVAVAGCSSSSQALPGASGQAPFSNGTAGVARSSAALRNTAWLSSEAKAGKGLLFVADQADQRVAIFSQKGGSPIGSITDAIAGPDGLYVDRQGTLYVCNFGAGTVTEYLKGKTTHSKTLTGMVAPKYVAAGRDGTVYVSDFNGSSNGKLYEYAHGSTTPTTTVTFASFPAGVALDRHNDVYVAYNDPTYNDIEVLQFEPGSTKGDNLGIHIKSGYAGGLTFDKKQDLLVVDQSRAQVDVYPPGATTPSNQIGGFPIAYQLALNRKNTRLFVSSGYSASVAEVAYPAGTPVQTFTSSLNGAFGVATSPDSSY